jgi:hypothetical protein
MLLQLTRAALDYAATIRYQLVTTQLGTHQVFAAVLGRAEAIFNDHLELFGVFWNRYCRYTINHKCPITSSWKAAAEPEARSCLFLAIFCMVINSFVLYVFPFVSFMHITDHNL